MLRQNGAKIGTPGVVAHMFDHQAVFQFQGDDEEAILEALMMADAEVTDIEHEDGVITVFAPNTEFFKVKTALNEAFPDLTLDVEEITFVPQNRTVVSGEDAENSRSSSICWMTAMTYSRFTTTRISNNRYLKKPSESSAFSFWDISVLPSAPSRLGIKTKIIRRTR